MSLRVDLDQKISKNADRILAGRLEKCRLALQQDDPHQAVHEVRKQLKKIRAFSRLMRGEIGEKSYKMTNMYYRDLGHKMSEARDAAAMLETLDLIKDSVDNKPEEKALQDIKNHLSARKSAVTRILFNRKELLDTVETDLQRAESIHDSWKIKHNNFAAFRGGLGKTYKRCRKAMKKAYKKNTPEAFHDWRKRSKYLRYHINLLREIWHHPMKGMEKELHQLTDYLGDDHDLTVLKKQIEAMDYENKEAKAYIINIIDRKKAELQRLARPLGEKLLLDNKKDFLNRIKLYWDKSLKEFKMLHDRKPLGVS